MSNTTSSTKKRWPTVVGTGLVALIIGAAAGWFLQPTISGDEDASVVATGEPSTGANGSVPATDSTVAAPTAPAGTVIVGHHTGAFEVAVPADWQRVSIYTRSIDNPYLITQPDTSTNDYTGGGGLSLALFTTGGLTPTDVLNDFSPSSSCTSTADPAAFSHGEFAGLIRTSAGCDNGYSFDDVAVETGDGSILRIRNAYPDAAGQARLTTALDTFALEVSPGVETLPISCPPYDDSPDPTYYPVTLLIINLSGDTATLRVQGPPEVQPSVDSIENQLFQRQYASPGDVWEVTLSGGTTEYPVTADTSQCLLATPDGVVPVPG